MSTSLDATPSVAAGKFGRFSALLDSLRQNSLLLAVVAIWLVVANSMSAISGRPHRVLDGGLEIYAAFLAICLACFAAAFCIWVVYTALVRKVSIQTRDFWRLMFKELLSRERVLLALPILAVWPALTNSFSLMKSLIPMFHPFSMDPFLHEADRFLHFGHDPWALLQPLLGHPLITFAIDRLYALWLFVIYFALLLQITSTANPRLRLNFLLSSALAWPVIGGVIATLLSSAGPCYFDAVVGGPGPYAPLMDYLRHTVQGTPLPGIRVPIDLMALRVQNLLWGFYQSGDFGIGFGVSAAPSMHVASTWLVARMLQHYGRIPAILGWSFFGVILVGSVHLGWHYALDGYIAILLAWIIWHAVSSMLDLAAVQRFLWPAAAPLGR